MRRADTQAPIKGKEPKIFLKHLPMDKGYRIIRKNKARKTE
jgi:hypothetical protein